jgi:hypothetical protein
MFTETHLYTEVYMTIVNLDMVKCQRVPTGMNSINAALVQLTN